MELINNQYIKLDKFDIFGGQIEALEESNEEKGEYYSKLISSLLDYEKREKKFINSIYIDKESTLVKKYTNKDDIIITRQSIINALLLAMIKNETDMALKLQPFLKKNEIFICELGELLNYVLEHNIHINEYYNGEHAKIIYNEETNNFEKGYIYNNEKLKEYLNDYINDIANIKEKTKKKNI